MSKSLSEPQSMSGKSANKRNEDATRMGKTAGSKPASEHRVDVRPRVVLVAFFPSAKVFATRTE
jgi:hypothetical protein